MKKIIVLLIAVLLCFNGITSFAEETKTAEKIENYTAEGVTEKMKDDKYSSYSLCDGITYSGTGVKSIFIAYWDTPCKFTFISNGKSTEYDITFLHYTAELDNVYDNFQIKFSEPTNISEIAFYGDGVLPPDVQNWQSNDSPADLLLFSTHADDEQLFFAGILPYYAIERGYRVQVAYFTDHANEPYRRHELLNGLWTVGVKRYPVISKFPDMYSETFEDALKNLSKSGYNEDSVYAYQVEILRRFKPLVLVEHDLGGEYKHGQHILNSNCMTKSVEYAADPTKYTDSYERYGVWNTPKMYVHLYDKSQISLDVIDVPTDKLGGKSPFQITQEGFKCHYSQQDTWFTAWLNGKNGNVITKASQIDKYSPLNFGLYRTTVGEDALKNDFFENLTNYDETERLQKEKEAKEKEELNKKKAEKKTENKNNFKIIKIILIVLLILFVLLLLIFIALLIYKSVVMRRRKKARKRRNK